MGLLDIFKKKSRGLIEFEAKLQTAFSRVFSDIKQLRTQFDTLHSGHELTKEDIKNISLWLGYLKRDTEKAENNFEKIGAWISYLHQQNEKAQKQLEIHENHINLLKQHVATGVATFATPKTNELSRIKHEFKDFATGVGNVANVGNVAFATLTTPNELPNPLKNLLNLMIAMGEPVSYELVSEKTGKSRITVRVNMNRLKRRGLVEEFTTPKGTKLFAVKNSEKIKKLYNVEAIS